MDFIDEIKIMVRGGAGGSGCVSFHREKFIPNGGPDGGNGGDGGTVILQGDHNLTTLVDLKKRKRYIATSGASGKGNNMTGKRGAHTILRVPVGTIVRDLLTEDIFEDIDCDGKTFHAAKGGMGGRGNASFKSSINRAPRFAQPGLPGEEFSLKLELKLLADVGIIGLPNAGKSTLISRISAVRPKIANYPFTTLIPNLGVVKTDEERSFVAADIPGLIKGAHSGRGLGDKFLKHIERTSVLLHLVDLSDIQDRDPVYDFDSINNELELFNPDICRKPQVVVGNKVDTLPDKTKLEEFEKAIKEKGLDFFTISAATGEGVKQLTYHLSHMVDANKRGRISTR